jgi:hypothetical protein
MLVISHRASSGHILEALHIDPASGVSPENDKSTKVSKPAVRYCAWTDIHDSREF